MHSTAAARKRVKMTAVPGGPPGWTRQTERCWCERGSRGRTRFPRPGADTPGLRSARSRGRTAPAFRGAVAVNRVKEHGAAPEPQNVGVCGPARTRRLRKRPGRPPSPEPHADTQTHKRSRLGPRRRRVALPPPAVPRRPGPAPRPPAAEVTQRAPPPPLVRLLLPLRVDLQEAAAAAAAEAEGRWRTVWTT